MYLKSLELQGFKSFPDKIKLTFDKGLTAVVGPNGSGKSNIGDSIRWVLGEQSTKTLRGNKMEDVIFSGTVKRKAMGFAMVTLTLDNSDHALNSEDNEVSVTRKLYRSGESEYRINGKNVRLKDINELFMDTGLGRDGYSIIGQGRIAEIVGAKSSERRDIFEEAAGISKFRYKKQEAERKLAAAEDNLNRLSDIVAELESRVGPLKKQAEKAEKFLQLSKERRTLEVSVWVNKLSQLKEKITELENALLIAKTEYENIKNDIDREEEKIKDGYAKMQQNSAEVERLRDEILKTEQSSSDSKAEIAVFENDIKHCNDTLGNLKRQREELLSGEEKTRQLIKEKLESADKLDEDIKTAEQELEHLKKELEDIRLEDENLGRDSENASGRINELYAKLSEYSAAMSNSDTSVIDINEQLESLDEQRGRLKELADQYAKERGEIADGIKVCDEKIEELANKQAGAVKLYQDKSKQLEAASQDKQKLTMDIKGKEQRIKILRDLEHSMEGFARSVKEVMKARDGGRIGGIRGTVADLINVKPEYATALETALGSAMQNVIVEDDTAAKRCIRMLKENKSGRATFLPMSSIKGRLLNEPSLYKEDGFISMANELVEYEDCYREIVNSLLGRTAVAEDIDMAAVIAKRYGYKFRIVTLDGQVVNAGGSFTGGSAVHSAGVFSRRNELSALTEEIENKKTDYARAEEKAQKLHEECDRLRLIAEGLREQSAQINEDKTGFAAELMRIDALRKQSEEQSADFKKRYTDLCDRKNKASENARTANEEFKKTQILIRDAETFMAQEKGKREEIRKKREQLSEGISEQKIKLTEMNSEAGTIRRDAQTLEESIKNAQNTLSGIETQEKALLDTIEAKKQLISDKKKFVDSVSGIIGEHNADIAKLRKEHDEVSVFVNQVRSGIQELNNAKEKYSGDISKAEERRDSTQRDLDSIVDQLFEVYELTRSEAEEEAQEIDDPINAQKELSRLRSEIKALGSVNVGAVDEYKEVSERYNFMSEQLDDVNTSKRELEKLIEDLTEDMCRIFSESFVIINKNFGSIFRELFGGGKAELVLTDPENVLESGIEIRVAPPGKVIKNLISLSGGEQSFVAICIYFAILRLKPAPFCILDEIDAALDEVNVGKYARYLKQFTDTTQFVLVTHRRSAMEEANVLYGVTMQEDGISKLLKMEQTDIDDSQTGDKEAS